MVENEKFLIVQSLTGAEPLPYVLAMSRKALFLASLCLFSACAKKEKNNGLGQVTPKASSPDEAMAWLSVEDRKKLSDWKENLLKSCSASQIFSGERGATPSLPAVDLKALYVRTGDSLSITNPETQSIISFGSLRPLLGLENS